MFGFLRPKYVNEAGELYKGARKLLDYRRDLWSEVTVADFEVHMKRLREAMDRRDERAVTEAAQQLDEMAGKFSPPPKDAGWRENCEVFLVAIVVALGVRTYFLQPFTIPTGSMQPTLNGIIGYPTKDEPPNIVTRTADELILGRGYINTICNADGAVDSIKEIQRFRFFTYTQIECGGQTYTIHAPMDTLMRYFGVDSGREYHKGDVIARGYVETGDHVFVDKISYNFHTPTRGNVFVFSTKGIAGIESENARRGIFTSQFYIKRLAGLPDDELRIDSPNLYINGSLGTEFGFQRVMAAKDGYRGYGQGPGNGYLSAPDNPFRLPPRSYFALGDNSYNSLDSRYWGTVPQGNIMGRGLFVYWPFNSHWGLIK
jgi:signal peptidase I